MRRTLLFTPLRPGVRARRALGAAAPILLLVAVGLAPTAVTTMPVVTVHPAADPADPAVTPDPGTPDAGTPSPTDPPTTVASTPPPTVASVALPAAPSSNPIGSWGTGKAGSKAQRVNAVVVANGVAYFGGAFTQLVGPGGKTASRSHLAAVDGKTGNLVAWNPHADGAVWSMELAADGHNVYVGGDFKHIAGRSTGRLAKIDLLTGQPDPQFKSPVSSGRVRALKLDGARLYAGGEFTKLGGAPRPKLGAVDPLTGAVLPWTPPPLGPGRYLTHTGIPTPDYSPGHVFSIAVIGGKVFASGNFLNFAGQGGLVTLDAASGALSTPQYNPGRPVFDLDTSGGILYAVGGGPGGRGWAFSPDTATPLWTAKFDGDAVGVVASADIVYIAGHYDYIVAKNSSCYQTCPGGPLRHHLSAFTTAGGKLVAWNPAADTSTGPETVAIGPDAVYVGGEFTRINGASHPGIAIFPGTP